MRQHLAALLFLAPLTTLVGGYGLLLIFASAIAIHFQSGGFGICGLIVYAMAGRRMHDSPREGV
jgi:hypothetical protein